MPFLSLSFRHINIQYFAVGHTAAAAGFVLFTGQSHDEIRSNLMNKKGLIHEF